MEVESRIAAARLGVSQRQVQRLARSGRIVGRSIAGRIVLGDRSLVAASRSVGRGRHWSDHTAAAAAELLEHGGTDRLEGSQRSRLRARLRTIAAPELAYQLLGDRVTIWRRTRPVAGAVVADDSLSSTGGHFEVEVVDDDASFARRSRLLEDADGDVLVVKLATTAPGIVRDVVFYAYGDVRASSAALERIRSRQAALA